MTQTSKTDYARAVLSRYLQADKAGKSAILNEFCLTTGCHRKHAIRKLRRLAFGPEPDKQPRGASNKYSGAAEAALISVWQACDCICAERLQPFLPTMVAKLKACGELSINQAVETELLRMSRATIGRRIARHHKLNGRVLISTTKPGSLLKKDIPLQLSSWEEQKPGFLEIDLVAHCGDRAEGDFINTLNTVDIATGWNEKVAVMGKAQSRVFIGIKTIQARLPFPLRGLDSDNGSEFINHLLWRYCKAQNIAFTRSRPYHKNDNAHIEQKNWTTVRKVLGYDRFASPIHLRLINDLYGHELRWYTNFFQPVLKLKEKKRVGARIIKHYYPAQTPYQRVLASPDVPEETKQQLTNLYQILNPVQLRKIIERKINTIVSLTQ